MTRNIDASQALVNAQTSVNRAVFDMNRARNGGGENGPDYIIQCIDSARKELTEARRYYARKARKGEP